MPARPPRVHVCFGTPPHHLLRLRAIATGTQEPGWWTINTEALPGDRITFYLVRPVSAFVATGVVASKPRRVTDPRNPWFGEHAVDIDKVILLSSQTPIAFARKRFPSWDWLFRPRRSTVVPGQIANKFFSFLGERTDEFSDYADERAIEGTKTETRRMTTKRSRRIRDLAFSAANNMCAVCDRDYSKVLNGRGVRVLQVHHRKQLSSFDAPTLVGPRDLAVVCANCHLLIHYNPKKALTVQALRKLLQARSRR